MKSNVLTYKGYCATPEYRPDDQIIYGTILGISDLVDFYSESAKDIEEEFHKAVDDYLDFCMEVGKPPQKAYRGSFNVRIDPELHRKAAIQASISGISLNQFVGEAIEKSLNEEERINHLIKTAAITATCQTSPLIFSANVVSTEGKVEQQSGITDSIHILNEI